MTIDPVWEKADNQSNNRYFILGSRLQYSRLPKNIQNYQESLHTHEST
ncbi:hypothetical protein SALWKB29_0419 [Snodgrassella communis]|uniref:Uncharacterized protein n=1 Tax=Snodgrassella communis TaxID=2946699 RepID=A0A836MRY1_9NEIS|nr:hypothetical protein SALWKB29_0419 [Snodgrassella communis]